MHKTTEESMSPADNPIEFMGRTVQSHRLRHRRRNSRRTVRTTSATPSTSDRSIGSKRRSWDGRRLRRQDRRTIRRYTTTPRLSQDDQQSELRTADTQRLHRQSKRGSTTRYVETTKQQRQLLPRPRTASHLFGETPETSGECVLGIASPGLGGVTPLEKVFFRF